MVDLYVRSTNLRAKNIMLETPSETKLKSHLTLYTFHIFPSEEPASQYGDDNRSSVKQHFSDRPTKTVVCATDHKMGYSVSWIDLSEDSPA